ncbi:MAG: diaminobutyrate-2-oxoglutarate transaminase [Planctomycetota bacterium]|jgi:diaminobutyrate-2-oxoglutarate transaminase
MNPPANSPSMKTFQRHESSVRSYVRAFPAVFDKARGSRMYDDQGRMYLDFFSGAGALNYGHNDPKLKEPLLEYVAGDGITHSLDMATKAKQAFIERFQAVVLEPRGLSYKFLFPGPTGTNAIEAALKLARKSTGRTGVVAFEGGFHGMTLGALSITSNAMKREGAGLPLENADLLPFDGDSRGGVDSLSFLRRSLRQAAAANELPAAIVLETVQCEGGVRVASNKWLRGVEQACRDLGVLLIVDDIQAGCGRTGKFFSFEEAGLRPDIVCLSKSLSGLGLPLALVLVREELDVFRPGEHNGTFRGHNPAFVTATAALDYWADDVLEEAVRQKSNLLRDHLEGIVEINDGVKATVRGRGMVQGVAFDDPTIAGAISAECFKRGLIIETAGHKDEVLKFLPALTIDRDTLKAGLAVVRESLHVVIRDLASEPVLAHGGKA